MRETKNKQKKNHTDSKVEAFIDQPRCTTPHSNNAATLISGKQKKKFGIMHQKIENKGNKSYGQFSRNLERKIKKTASIMLY